MKKKYITYAKNRNEICTTKKYVPVTIKEKVDDIWSDRGHEVADTYNAIKEKAKNIKENLLKEIGFDPTVRYTNVEKRKFTREFKAKQFSETTAPVLTMDAQLKLQLENARIQAIKLAMKKVRFDLLPYQAPKCLKQPSTKIITPVHIGMEKYKENKPKVVEYGYAIQRLIPGSLKVETEASDFLSATSLTAAEAIIKSLVIDNNLIDSPLFAGVQITKKGSPVAYLQKTFFEKMEADTVAIAA